MARVLFLNIPMDGHVLPTLDIVTELVNRGEQVTYFLTDHYAPAIRATGAAFQRYESTIKDRRPPDGRFSHTLVEESLHVIPQVIERIRDIQPDYIIYESNCLWGRLLSGLFQVPVISCRAGLAVNRYFSHISSLLEMSEGDNLPTAPLQMLVQTFNDLHPLRELCANYELPPPELSLESLFFPTEDLNIIFTSRFLQPAGETFDERFIFIGSSLDTRQAQLPPFDIRPLHPQGAPVVYISLGTIYNMQPDFYKLCFRAFGHQSYRVITSLGREDAPLLSETVPENILLRSLVPQLAVLQQSDVFITHGGLNSVMEALYYGVPMIIIPQMPEQLITARRLADLGLGIVLDKNTITSGTLFDAVQTLLRDPQIPPRMEQAQQEVHASGGVRRAVDTILQFVMDKQPASITHNNLQLSSKMFNIQ